VAIPSNLDNNRVHTCNVVVLILVYLPVCVKVLITSIAHTNGILPVSLDNVVMLGTRPAHNSTTAPAVMSAIELKKQNTVISRISFACSFHLHSDDAGL